MQDHFDFNKAQETASKVASSSTKLNDINKLHKRNTALWALSAAEAHKQLSDLLAELEDHILRAGHATNTNQTLLARNLGVSSAKVSRKYAEIESEAAE